MTNNDNEKLAALIQKVNDMSRRLDQNTKDTAAIKSSLDNLTGGKQALMWFTGVIMSILIVIATWLGFHHK